MAGGEDTGPAGAYFVPGTLLTKHAPRVSSFSPPHTPVRPVVLSPFSFTAEETDPERLSNLLKVSQLGKGELRWEARQVWFWGLMEPSAPSLSAAVSR